MDDKLVRTLSKIMIVFVAITGALFVWTMIWLIGMMIGG